MKKLPRDILHLMLRHFAGIALLVCAGGLNGCGQTGALYLPDANTNTPDDHTQITAEATEAERDAKTEAEAITQPATN